MRNSAILIAALLVAGCAKKTVPTVENIESKRVTITPRRVPVTVKADTSAAAYRFTPGPSPKIEKLASVAGERAAEPWVELDTAGVLRIKCPCLEHTENVTVNDTKEETDKTVTITKVEYINELTGWQWFQIWTGRILLGILTLWIVYLIFIRRYFGK